MIPCLVCNSDQLVTILDLGPQPVSSHFTVSSGAPVVERNIVLTLCRSCGIVQLAQPYPYNDLIPPYDWITYREPESHLDAVVDAICCLPNIKKDGVAAGLSFKDETTLDRLRGRGFSQTWVIDVHRDLGAENPNANIESVHGLLTPESAGEMVGRYGLVDVLIARHILEHAGAPQRFMQALGSLIAPGGYLVIEVPDCRANLKRQDYTMIWEEHSLYFTQETLPQVLAATGFESMGLEIHPFPFEDVILLYARKSGSQEGASAEVNPSAIEENITRARAYGAAFETWTARYRDVLDELTKGGKPLAVYGAGHLTSAFINFHGLADYFAFVVDDTPQKHGLHLPKCGLPIVPNSRLSTDEVSACLFGLAPQIEDKVIASNPQFTEAGGRYYSMFADSKRSIRGLFEC